jgi:radical SAM superfamily enzyme YgiQ (UPF0313 family)
VLKVLFIHKNYFSEPMGILYLSAYLRREGHETDFFDIGLEDGVEDYVAATRPDVIGYSIVTGSEEPLFRANMKLKKVHDFFAVFGGPHATFFPECVQEEGVDAICRGEAEEALAELVTRLEAGDDVTGVANFWVKKDGKIHRNEPRNLHENLDTLPFPDRDLLNRYRAYAGLRARRILTARGCPFNCSYCYNRALGELYRGRGTKLRRRSVENVISEISAIFDMGPVSILHISDDTFVIDRSWLEAFAERYEPMAVPVTRYARAEFLTREVARDLARIRCAGVHVGIETADEDMRRRLLHRKMSNELLENAAAFLRAEAVPLVTQSMIGLPGETFEGALNTLRFNARLRPALAAISLFQPYPGTELAGVAEEMGLVDHDASIPSYLWRGSVLRLPQKHRFENLAQLFSLATAYPTAIPLVIALTHLPKNPLFRLLGGLFKFVTFARLGYIHFGDILRWFGPRTLKA